MLQNIRRGNDTHNDEEIKADEENMLLIFKMYF